MNTLQIVNDALERNHQELAEHCECPICGAADAPVNDEGDPANSEDASYYHCEHDENCLIAVLEAVERKLKQMQIYPASEPPDTSRQVAVVVGYSFPGAVLGWDVDRFDGYWQNNGPLVREWMELPVLSGETK